MTRFARCPFVEARLGPGPMLALILALILALPTTAPAQADPMDWRFQGFASQRLTATSGNNDFFGDTSDGPSGSYREIGAGFSWTPASHWLLSGQAIHRHGGNSEEDTLEADYLFLAWSPFDLADGELSLRAGKIKVPYGLFNEGRDTPMTRPGILPPQSIYLDALRGFNQSAFGLHLGGEWNWDLGSVSLDLTQMKPNVEGTNPYLFFVGDNVVFPGSLDSSNGDAFAARLAYDHDGGRVRAMFSHARGKARYQPGIGDIWQDGQLDPTFTTLSLQWNGERLSLSWEHSRNVFRSHYESAFVPDLDLKSVGSSEYLQAEWRFNSRWTGLLRHDRLYLDDDDKDGSAFAAANPGKPPWMRYAKDWTLGLRYRPDEHWLLAGEYHRVDGISWLPPADNLSGGIWDAGATDRRWDLFLLQATYQF